MRLYDNEAWQIIVLTIKLVSSHVAVSHVAASHVAVSHVAVSHVAASYVAVSHVAVSHVAASHVAVSYDKVCLKLCIWNGRVGNECMEYMFCVFVAYSS